MVEGTDLWLTGDDLSCLIELVKIEPGEGKAFGRRDIDGLLCRLQEAYGKIGKHCSNCRHFDVLNRRCQLEGWRTAPHWTCSRFEPSGGHDTPCLLHHI